MNKKEINKCISNIKKDNKKLDIKLSNDQIKAICKRNAKIVIEVPIKIK